MAASKKDFDAIARILKRTAHAYCCDGADAVEEITDLLADYFDENVPSFDRERFLQASAPDSPAERERKRAEMALYANLNS
jgi:hypothetical protein